MEGYECHLQSLPIPQQYTMKNGWNAARRGSATRTPLWSVTDVTIPGYTWRNKLVEIHEPRNYLYMTGGGIGQGLPMAIGAKMGQPNKPVVLIAGDGGFMVNANEMITAIQ